MQGSDQKVKFKNTRSRFYSKQASFDNEQGDSDKSVQENTGAYWKQKGNGVFKLGMYQQAINCYTRAIELNPGDSTYYSNRSRCYQKMRNYDMALKDAESACELSEDNIKAHYICGCILGELGKKDTSKLRKAQNRLNKALRLCATLKKNQYQDDISIKYLRLKKLIWFKQEEKEYNCLQLQRKYIIEQHDKEGLDNESFNLIIDRIDKRLQKMKEIKDIPDHLACKITLQLMEDPVVSEGGFTYERKALEQHYKLKGPVEPITRNQCRGIIIPNQALKTAIQQFLTLNPWAYEHDLNEDYHNINMI